MQRTRFNTIIDNFLQRIQEFFNNPWRYLALNLIALLFGNFLGTAIITTFGQMAEWDIVAAAFILLITEVITRLFYNVKFRTKFKRSLWLDCLNIFRIGIVYSLFVEAFKVGS